MAKGHKAPTKGLPSREPSINIPSSPVSNQDPGFTIDPSHRAIGVSPEQAIAATYNRDEENQR